MNLFSLSKVSILIFLGGCILPAFGVQKASVFAPSGYQDLQSSCVHNYNYNSGVELCSYSRTTNVANALGNLVYGKVKVCATAAQGIGFLPFIWACHYDWQPGYRAQLILTQLLGVPFLVAPGVMFILLYVGGCPSLLPVPLGNEVIPGIGLSGLEIRQITDTLIYGQYPLSCVVMQGYNGFTSPTGGNGVAQFQSQIIMSNIGSVMYISSSPIQNIQKRAESNIFSTSVNVTQIGNYAEITRIGSTKSTTCTIQKTQATAFFADEVVVGDLTIAGQLSIPFSCSSITGILQQISRSVVTGYFQLMAVLILTTDGEIAFTVGYTFNTITAAMVNAVSSGCYHQSCQ